MIAGESMRAIWCRGRGDNVIVGFEWIATTGGEDAVSHHLAHLCEIVRRPYISNPVHVLVKLEDPFGPDPMLQALISQDWSTGDQFSARLQHIDEPPLLRTTMAVIPVVYASKLNSCQMTIRRGSDYVRDHMCWIEARRHLEIDGEHAVITGQTAIISEDYHPMKETR